MKKCSSNALRRSLTRSVFARACVYDDTRWCGEMFDATEVPKHEVGFVDEECVLFELKQLSSSRKLRDEKRAKSGGAGKQKEEKKEKKEKKEKRKEEKTEKSSSERSVDANGTRKKKRKLSCE